MCICDSHSASRISNCWQPSSLLVAHGPVLLSKMDWEDNRPFLKDLRNGLRSDRRYQKLKQKYCSFRGVQPSWPGQKVYKFIDRRRNSHTLEKPTWVFAAPLVTHRHELAVDVWTKRDQYNYRECDLWPGNCFRRRGKTGRRCSICVPSRWEHLRTTKVKNRLIENGLEDAFDADMLELYNFDYTFDILPDDRPQISTENITKPDTPQDEVVSHKNEPCFISPLALLTGHDMQDEQAPDSWVVIRHEDQSHDLQEDWVIL